MGTLRRLRFITRRRLKWVAAIAAGLVAALFVSTLWISPRFLSGGQKDVLWLHVDRGRVKVLIYTDGPLRIGEWNTKTSIYKHSPIGFDLWFVIERKVSMSSYASFKVYILEVPLWFPFVVCAAAAFYLWRTDRPKPWQCASCRYDLRGIDSDLCPECGKQSARAS